MTLHIILLALSSVEKDSYVIQSSAPVADAASNGLSFADFAAISLSCVSVILTIVALAIGIGSIWGYNKLKEIMQEASRKHLEARLKEGELKESIERLIVQHVSDQLKSGVLREILEKRVDMLIYGDASTRAEGAEANPPNPPVAGEDEQPFEG